jgi:HlyD family secretion protein
MSIESLDLSTLSRGPAGGNAPVRNAATAMPQPPMRWKTRILLPGVLLGTAASVLAYSGWSALTPKTPVRVVPVVWRSGSDAVSGGGVVVQAPGWVEPDPFAIGVSALTDGIVCEVLVLEGQRIEAGQVVARLIADDARIAVDRAEAELAEATAKLANASAGLTAAQSTWDNPIALNAALAIADATVAERQGELDRWPAELASEQARAEELSAEAQRISALNVKEQGTDIELLRAQKQGEAAAALADSTRRRKPILDAKLAGAKAERVAAAENLRLRIADAKGLAEERAAVAEAAAAVRRSDAMLAEARLRLERTDIKTPVAGVVLSRLVEPGSRLMLNADMPRANQVVRLYDPDRLQVRIDIPLAEAAKVGIGMKAEIVAQILPDRVYHGEVTRVLHEADIQRNTLQVKVRIDDPSADLKPEMLARARFLGKTAASSAPDPSPRVFVPQAYVHRGEGGHAHVMVVNQARQTAELRVVALGNSRIGDAIEIVDGLRPGDRVIADDPARIQDGMKISIVGEAPTAESASASHGAGGH